MSGALSEKFLSCIKYSVVNFYSIVQFLFYWKSKFMFMYYNFYSIAQANINFYGNGVFRQHVNRKFARKFEEARGTSEQLVNFRNWLKIEESVEWTNR